MLVSDNWKTVGWIVKFFGKYGRKVSRIVIKYRQHGRKATWKVSRIVIKYGQHGRKASWNSQVE
jgi:hypothetical protein